MMKIRNILSLFNGMSCGQIALDRAGIEYDNYYSSEIDKWAIKVNMENYPDTIQLGDIENWREWDIDWSSIDLLIGGSPCQGFSFAGKQLAFDDHRSRLFFVFVDILRHVQSVNPDVKFMLENVRMKKEWTDVISQQLGVCPRLINSALVSAQNRNRLYWANWEFDLPEDNGITLMDVVDSEFTSSSTLCDEIDKAYLKDYLLDNRIDICFGMSFSDNSTTLDRMVRQYRKLSKKANSLTATSHKGMAANGVTNIFNGIEFRKITVTECERLQTVPDGYTSCVSNTQAYKMIGNGWTVDAIAHIFRALA